MAALTEANRNKCARILGVTPLELTQQINWLGADNFTPQVQIDIEAELTAWTTAGAKFVNVNSNLKNFGAEIRPDRQKDDIRHNIAVMLQRLDWSPLGGAGSGGSVQGVIYRG